MMRIPASLAVLLLALMSGVQAAPPGEYAGVSPKDLQAVPDARTVELGERLVWTRSARNTELGVLPGKYTAHWQDAQGQYFLAAGPAFAFYMRSVRGHYLLARGGVLLPHAASARARFFFVQDDRVKTGKTLEEALSAPAPDEPAAAVPLLDALLNWASRGHVVALAEIDDDALNERLRAAFTAR
jgi:hypothetical protein